ncbi:MAG: hypothetical protein KF794_01250 [Xanthobacteraceae bacterium]|nr:hypothetical protein [Xanthobacteraceae bacterium]QYK45372.1 MAG: hypothetical protein KF794_01250 [Xanthobacteraceae bacterium]
MSLVDWVLGIPAYFRRKPPIDTREKLIDFLDSRAAFLIQKNIFDYARARSGPYFSYIIKEKAFQESVEVSRWTGYPTGLAAVAEIVRGVLFNDADRKPLNDAISSAALAAFDKYPVPKMLGAETWKKARETLIERLANIDTHPPKFAKDVILPYAQILYDSQPIHEELRKRDFEMIQAQLRINLVNMHDEFESRARKAELLSDLGVAVKAA